MLSNELNKLELYSILVSLITIYCGLFYLTKDIGEEVKIALLIMIVLANSLFLIQWIKEYAKLIL